MTQLAKKTEPLAYVSFHTATDVTNKHVGSGSILGVNIKWRSHLSVILPNTTDNCHRSSRNFACPHTAVLLNATSRYEDGLLRNHIC